MPTVIGVRFKRTGKIYYFDPNNLDIEAGGCVIVETVRGVEFGEVMVPPKEVGQNEVVAPLKKVLRICTDEDMKQMQEIRDKEKKALDVCADKIEKHELPMCLVDVEYTFDSKKIIFYFTAEGRVDFRELVKDLASEFKTRIELRQIGVRDEAKMKGGIGPCGREICCKAYLGDFHPVSIKMAKDQQISLNPTKISGLCGRLMCCLQYEHEFYEKMKAKAQKPGSSVMTPAGPGYVLDNQIIEEKCRVKVSLPGENVELKEFPFDDVHKLSPEEMERELKKVSEMPVNNYLNNSVSTWDAPVGFAQSDNNNRGGNKAAGDTRNKRKSGGRKRRKGKPDPKHKQEGSIKK